MHRTQILLEDWQYENLKIISQETGKSISAVIRDMITMYTDKNNPGAVLENICAIGEDPTGYGKDHDTLLYGRDSVENG